MLFVNTVDTWCLWLLHNTVYRVMRCENSSLYTVASNTIYVEAVNTKHIHTFLPITFLIFNQFSICKKFWKAETEGFSIIPLILYMLILSIQDKDL